MMTEAEKHEKAGARLIVVSHMLTRTQNELSDAQIAVVRELIDDLINEVNRSRVSEL